MHIISLHTFERVDKLNFNVFSLLLVLSLSLRVSPFATTSLDSAEVEMSDLIFPFPVTFEGGNSGQFSILLKKFEKHIGFLLGNTPAFPGIVPNFRQKGVSSIFLVLFQPVANTIFGKGVPSSIGNLISPLGLFTNHLFFLSKGKERIGQFRNNSVAKLLNG